MLSVTRTAARSATLLIKASSVLLHHSPRSGAPGALHRSLCSFDILLHHQAVSQSSVWQTAPIIPSTEVRYTRTLVAAQAHRPARSRQYLCNCTLHLALQMCGTCLVLFQFVDEVLGEICFRMHPLVSPKGLYYLRYFVVRSGQCLLGSLSCESSGSPCWFLQHKIALKHQIAGASYCRIV